MKNRAASSVVISAGFGDATSHMLGHSAVKLPLNDAVSNLT
jgi:hypothetical protein